MKRFFNYSFSIFLVQFILFAQNKSVVAVLDFNNDDPGLQQHLEDHLKKAQYIELMPRNVWFNLLSQKVNRSRFRPTNTSAAAKMGKMIKADYIVYGTSKYGFILVNLIDVANRSKATAIRRNFNTNQLAYYDMVPEIIKSLDQKLSNLTGYKQPKKIFAPPALAATLKFDEPSGNQYLDALETGKITLEIINTGSGLGTGIVTTVNPKSTAYLNYKVPEKIPVIKSGDSYNIDILLDARIGIDDAVHTLRFEFKEDNGFPPDPVEIQFSTKAYLKPEIYIVDVGIDDQNVNGMIEPGEIIKLTVRVGNRGKGTAKNTIARFYEGSDNVYLNDNPPNTVSIGDLFYNEYIDIPLEFFINMNAKEEIPLFVDLLEKSNLASVKNLRLPIKKSERARQIGRTVVTGIEQDYGQLTLGADLSIDIEQDIPEGVENKDAVAIVIGNKNYTNPDVPEVTFAHRDAAVVEQYLSKMLGYREVIVETDATQGKFFALFGTEKKDGKLQDYVKEGESDVFIYYSGHGAPDPESKDGYFVPVDCDPAMVDVNGYSLALFYNKINNLGAKSVTVVIDACFSGSSDQGMLLKNISPVFIEVDESGQLADEVTVFTSSSGEQVSSWYPEKKHSLYTYYFLKGLKGSADGDEDRSVTAEEIQSYVLDEVSYMARKLNSREQTPGLKTLDEEKVLIRY